MVEASYLVSVRRLQLLPHGFLQIPPHDGHPCRWLMVLVTKPIKDFRLLDKQHAGRTQISSRREPFGSRPLTPPYVRSRIRRFLLSSLSALPVVSPTIPALNFLATYLASLCAPLEISIAAISLSLRLPLSSLALGAPLVLGEIVLPSEVSSAVGV